MLQREDGPTEDHVFLISVEWDPKKVSIEDVKNHLSDALTWMEGTGKVEITHIGNMEHVEGDDDINAS